MNRLTCIALTLGLALVSNAHAAPRLNPWVGAWMAAQQVPEPQNALAPADLTDATLRQLVHVHVDGSAVRIRLSNAFGWAPLKVTSVHLARAVSPGSPRIDPATDHALTFDGHAEVIIPPGAEYLSDPLPLAVPAEANLAITLYLEQPPAQQTSHPGSRATSYLVHGDQVSAADLPDARRIDHWFQLSGVEVLRSGAAIVALGDSITDGHGATTNGDDRWPDFLARRLTAARRPLAVLNAGIGGNRVLLDGSGPNALARFDRDVLAQTGVRDLIILEGVNDLGVLTRDHPVSAEAHADLVRRLTGAYAQMVQRAHAHGIKVIGATILPYGGSDYYHPDALNETDRLALNRWIRAPGHFDAVIDLDQVMRDPAHPDRLRPAYDCGDHLHPSPAGYRAMAQAMPLGMFVP